VRAAHGQRRTSSWRRQDGEGIVSATAFGARANKRRVLPYPGGREVRRGFYEGKDIEPEQERMKGDFE
jgi:hypothetical protein